MKAADLIAAVRLWNGSVRLTDGDLKTLKAGFTFLSEFHREDCPIMAAHYRSELERVESMIEARKDT